MNIFLEFLFSLKKIRSRICQRAQGFLGSIFWSKEFLESYLQKSVDLGDILHDDDCIFMDVDGRLVKH